MKNPKKIGGYNFYDMEDRLIHKITNITILLIAISAIPLNVVIYFALEDGPDLLPRIIPIILGAVVIGQAVFRKKIKPSANIKQLTGLLFLVGCFNLSIGLIRYCKSLVHSFYRLHPVCIPRKKASLGFLGFVRGHFHNWRCHDGRYLSFPN